MAKLKIDRGTKYTRSGTVKLNGELQDLEALGSIIRFTMKETEYNDDWDDSDAIIVKDVTDGESDGSYNIVILPADTAELTPRKYNYDIKIDLNADGIDVYKLDEGTVQLDGSPTNRLS